MFNLHKSLHTLSKQLIHISANAWKKMKNINIETNKNTFLFAANTGGCGGLNYEFKNVDADVITEMSTTSKIPITVLENEELKVYIDPLSEMYLVGTTIDYLYQDYSQGIYESKFVFKPDKNIASSCGCGVSFYVKE
jgi:iron-sulfur cluster assembly accessory protein